MNTTTLSCTIELGVKVLSAHSDMAQEKMGIRFFSVALGALVKSHLIQMTEQDMTNMFKHTINPGDDHPTVLITAPTGSAPFQVGGSTIHAAFLFYDETKTKINYEK